MNIQRMHWAALVLVAGLSGAAQAALESRLDGQAVYDTDLNITWLANANLAATNNFGVSGYIANWGGMSWGTAQSWIGAMNAANYLGYNNWRLPTVNPINGSTFNYIRDLNGNTDDGYNMSEQGTAYAGSTGSEMAYLFYNSLNNKAQCDPVTSTASNCVYQVGEGLTNVGPFTNLLAARYWSGSEYAPGIAPGYMPGTYNYEWFFDFMHGWQSYQFKDDQFLAMAVLPGDVALTCTDPTCVTAATVSPPASVPDPDTWGLMLSGLALVGWAARRRSAVQ